MNPEDNQVVERIEIHFDIENNAGEESIQQSMLSHTQIITNSTENLLTPDEDPFVTGYHETVSFDAASRIPLDEYTPQATPSSWYQNIKSLFANTKQYDQETQDYLNDILGPHPVNNQHENKSRLPVDLVIVLIPGIGVHSETLGTITNQVNATVQTMLSEKFWDCRPLVIEVRGVYWKSAILPFAQQQRRLFINKDDFRVVVQDYVGDIIYFMTSHLGDAIVSEAYTEVERIFGELSADPERYGNSKVAMLGHSLGSAILYELISGKRVRDGKWNTEDPKARIPKPLSRKIDNVFFVGSPAAGFMSLHNNTLTEGIEKFNFECYNIFFQNDPIAFRLEPLLYPQVELSLIPKPVRIEHWRNIGENFINSIEERVKRTIKEASSAFMETLKKLNQNTDNSIAADIVVSRSSHFEKSAPQSWTQWITAKVESVSNYFDDPIESELMRKEKKKLKQQMQSGHDSLPCIIESNTDATDSVLHDDGASDISSNFSISEVIYPRIDYVLQDATKDRLVKQLSYLTSHNNYWLSNDLFFFIIRKMLVTNDNEIIISKVNWCDVVRERRDAELAQLEMIKK